MHGCKRQAQQHFILNQFNQTQSLAGLNCITVGQRVQSFQFGLVARQIQRALDFDGIRHAAKATLTGQPYLAADRYLEGQAAPLVHSPNNSTEQRTLRKFMGKTRKRSHVRLDFPRLRIPAKTPWIDFNNLKHGEAPG